MSPQGRFRAIRAGKHRRLPVKSMGDILGDARKLLAFTSDNLAGVKAGTIKLKEGVTREQAIAILEEEIANAKDIIAQYEWRDKA